MTGLTHTCLYATPSTTPSYNIGPGVLVRQQAPLKLSWATTVHKSQGSTLTRAILDISSCFEVGQAYVSLSRVKSINGLYLERRVSMNNILVSERVLDYYNMKRRGKVVPYSN